MEKGDRQVAVGSPENEPPHRRLKLSADVPFYIALAICISGLCAAALNTNSWPTTIAFAIIASAFILIRCCQRGWWWFLRSLAFFVLAIGLGADFLTGAIGRSVEYWFALGPLFALSIWLYLA
jgi:glucan phosphoethanolaminetransferase (alkaline phosphatase superfamily)